MLIVLLILAVWAVGSLLALCLCATAAAGDRQGPGRTDVRRPAHRFVRAAF